MKTAVAMAIATFENDTDNILSKEWVLGQLKFYQQIEEAQIKITYLHGGMAVLQKTEVKGDEYFAKEFNDSI